MRPRIPPGLAALGNVVSNRRNNRGGAIGAHPGALDRMVGGKPHSETGVSHPEYLPSKRRKRP